MLKRERISYNASAACIPTSQEYLVVRQSLIEVFNQVFSICNLQSRETIAVAVSYLDRFVASQQHRQMNVELAAMTCFYLAVKLHEPTVIAPSLVSKLFHKVLADSSLVSVKSIEAMELQVLSALKWNMNPPTSIMFARQLLCCLPDGPLTSWKIQATQVAQTYLEASVNSNKIMAHSASTQAVAALFIAVEQLEATQRIPVCKFLLQAVHMTGAQEQRQVLMAQAMIRSLVVSIPSAERSCAAAFTSISKRLTTADLDEVRSAKKQRVAIVEDSPESPRSVLA